MKESLIGSVVSTVTGTVESTANALTGTTMSTTAAPVSTTSTPTSTTATPSVAVAPSPSSTSAAPRATTSAPSATSTPSSTTSSPSATTTAPTSSASSTSSDFNSTPSPSTASTQTPSASNATAAPSTAKSTINTEASASASSSSNSSSVRLGIQDQTYTSIVVSSQSGSSSNQNGGEAGVTDVADTGVSTASIVGLVLGALGALLLTGLLVSWCLRRRRRQRMSSIAHVRLGATGNLPVFNTRGTERFETSSTSVSFGPFHTAHDESERGSTSDGTGRSELWEDEMIIAMRIPMEKLTTTSLLSSGGYGEVYRGVYRGESVAIKVLLPEKQKDLTQINAFLAEIKMMATIDHPSVVRFLGVAWDSLSDLSAVMEFMKGGDLRSLLDRFDQEHRPRGFDIDKARIALQTAQALTYLHSLDPKVLHRDLKSRNILVSSELDAKLSDFGVAQQYCFGSMTAAVGTSLWMAPEVMLGDRYDASADIFSFGVVLSELDSHLYPYADARMTNSGQRVPDAALLQLVAMGRVRVDFSSNAPTTLAELGRACVRLNPTTRPSANEVHYQLQLLLQSFEMYIPS